MKNYSLFFLLFLCAIILLFPSCTLEEEPDIPTKATNTPPLSFQPSELTVISHDSILARARLSSLGSNPILHHGWVWSENSNPSLQDSTNRSFFLDLGQLTIDFFEARIPDLKLGKTYYLRPFASSILDTIYGPESSVFMGMPKVEDVSVLSGADCFLRLQCVLRNPLPLLGYGIVFFSGSGTPTVQQNHGLATGSVNNDTFRIDLTMLNPNTKYSLRVFALTYYGIGYGKVREVTTPNSSVQVAFSINTSAEIFQGTTVQFTNLSTGANSFLWSFGDGDSSIVESPLHTYNTLGFMNVQLAAGNGSCILTKDTVLKILPDPFTDYLVIIPGGSFTMGCTPEQGVFNCDEDEEPVHLVTIDTFIMGKTEITQGQWLAVMGENSSIFNQCGPDCPVENVSWNEVQVFIAKLNTKLPAGTKPYRLPTEAEWEYAARGNESFKFAGSDDLDLVAWHSGNSLDAPHTVATKQPNGFGLYDMSGNVYEYIEDYYHDSYNGAPTDGSAWLDAAQGTARVLRGGGWKLDPSNCRTSNRAASEQWEKDNFTGFRLARSY